MGHEHFWTSGTDQAEEGKFFWMSTGKPMTYENWNAGEPNNFQYENGEQEHCLELWNRDGKGLRWNDTPCSFETFFVCEVWKIQDWILLKFKLSDKLWKHCECDPKEKKWIQVLVKTLVNASQNIQDDLFRPTYQGDNALQFSDTNLVNMRDSFNPYKQRSTSSGNFLIDAILVASSHGRPSFNQNWLVDPSPHSSLDQSSAIRVFLWKLY